MTQNKSSENLVISSLRLHPITSADQTQLVLLALEVTDTMGSVKLNIDEWSSLLIE